MTINSTLGPDGYTVSIPAPVSGGGAASAKSAILGHSIAGYNFGGVSITGATRASGTLTITATAHGLQTGGSFAMGGITNDPSMNGVWHRTVTRIDANSFSVPSPGSDGSAVAGGGFFGANLQALSAHGWWGWAQSLTGNRLDLVYAAVQGGATIEQIAAYVPAVIASGATACFVHAGVNSLTTDAADVAAGKLQSLILTPLLRAGMRVYNLAEFPFMSSHASFAAVTPKLQRFNRLNLLFCRANSGARQIDTYKALINPTSATAGEAQTNTMDSSYLHPSAKGARAAGYEVGQAIIADYEYANDWLIRSNSDDVATNTNSDNYLGVNGLLLGTSGVLSGSASGTMPTNWSATTSGTVTSAVMSLQARSDGCGNDIQGVITPGAANCQLIINSATAALFGKLVTGSWYQLGSEITATGVSASLLSNISGYMSATIDGVGYAFGTVNGLTGDTADTNDLTAVQLVSLPFWVPSGTTVTGVLFYIIARFSGASASALTLRAGRPTLRRRLDL
jgi:hypothetical protein